MQIAYYDNTKTCTPPLPVPPGSSTQQQRASDQEFLKIALIVASVDRHYQRQWWPVIGQARLANPRRSALLHGELNHGLGLTRLRQVLTSGDASSSCMFETASQHVPSEFAHTRKYGPQMCPGL